MPQCCCIISTMPHCWPMVQSPFDECWMKGSLCSTHYAKSRLTKASILQYDSPPLHLQSQQTVSNFCSRLFVIRDGSRPSQSRRVDDDVSDGLKCECANCYHWKRCPEFLWQDESDSTPDALETDKEVKRSHKFRQLTSKMITRWWSAQLNSVFLNCKNWKILL